MSNTDKLREIAEKWGWFVKAISIDMTQFELNKDTEQCLSDLTALISENYVAKEEVDKMVSERIAPDEDVEEEIKRILMNNFTRGDIKTATQQLDELFKEKYTQEWLVNNINKQSLGGIDLKQYVTNLLYSAYDKGVQGFEISLFDKWIEDMIDLIDRYYIWCETKSKKELLIAFLMEIDECYGMHIREEAEKCVTNYLKQIR